MKDERVPFLHQNTIDGKSQQLIGKYELDHNWDGNPPVPIEEIIEKHLNLSFDFDDLSKEEALGYILTDGNIFIDEGLDPEKHPSQEGRYRFTLAHEVGHWVLHQRLLNWETMQPSLIDQQGKPAIVCREPQVFPTSKKANLKPEEWQANAFAACLLMPSKLVLATRNDLGSDLHPDALCQILAERFEVSRTAMRIQLEALDLFHESTPPQHALPF